MHVVRSKKTVATLAALLAAAALAAVGLAAVLSQTVLVDGTNVHLRVMHTVASDFDSGWHTHPGLVVVQVQEGSLQITQGSCTPKAVAAGETFVETPFVPVRAVATGRVAWTTTLLVRYEDKLLTPLTTSPCP